jgi:hypothetical protein
MERSWDLKNGKRRLFYSEVNSQELSEPPSQKWMRD